MNIERYIGKAPKNYANCANAVLLYHGFAKKMEYYEPEEMQQWVETHTRKLKKGEKIRRGDILVLWAYEDCIKGLEQSHFAVYIGNKVFFHKPGMFLSYEKSTKEAILALYSDTEKYEYRRLK